MRIERTKPVACSLPAMLRATAIASLAAVLCWHSSFTDEAQAQKSVAAADGYEQIARQLQTLIRQEVAQKKLPAFSIALVDGERVVWAAGFGFQDADRKLPATASTVYRVGSISKLLTDVAVMQLVELGKLSLDAPIGKSLPDFAPKNTLGGQITLRQLMSHRSGLVREPPVGHYFDPDEPSLAKTVASLNDTSLVYKPGTKTKYSNAAIAVVGRLLEKQSGVSFSKRVEQSVLKPLGMNGSGFVLTPDIERNLATAWMWTYDGRRFEAPRFALGTAPAGNLYSTVLDLSKLIVAVFNDGRGEGGRVLKPETLRMMISPQQDEAGRPLSFGIGFHVSRLDGHRKIGHGGAMYGFSTQLEALPEKKLGVVAVSSLDGSNGVVRRIADYALRLLLARQEGKSPPKLQSTAPVPAERARQVGGRYRSGAKSIELSHSDGRLLMRRGSYRYELRMGDDGLVVDDVLGSTTRVERVSANVLKIGNDRYRRVADQKPPPAPKRWKGLIGEYGWDHNTLYILEDRGRLTALIEWFYYYPLTELGDDEFAFPNYGLYHGEKLRFTRYKSGSATHLVAAEVLFKRREVGTKDGETFRIEPVKPIDSLREAARKATPPQEAGRFRPTDFVELTKLDASIKLDVRYATTNNFTGAVFYRQPRAFMQQPAAEAVVRVHRRLREQGFGLLIHDAYRPWHVTKMFWDATPSNLKQFVANPANGSRHNRGCAVDLTLYDLKTGRPIPMVAGYDEFSPRSFPNYPGGTSRQRWHRALLRKAMEAEGFTIYEFEWWHFDYKDWRDYRIHNVSFEEILDKKEEEAGEYVLHTFERQQLTDVYYSEGASAGDINGDGEMDVVYGPYWFAGPDYKTKHLIYPAKPQPTERYADNFFSWIYDFNGDEHADVFVVGFPGTPAYVYENPGPDGLESLWKKHRVFDWVSNESPQFVNIVGDERPELVCTRDGFFGFATIDWKKPFSAWTFHPISEQITARRFGHGLGVGDVSGDGRLDVIFSGGWFEQPKTAAGDGRWKLHKAKLTDSYGGAEMYAYDVDGDGDNDIITSLAAHDFGLAWYEQLREGGKITFRQHLIMGDRPEKNRYGLVFSEPHSVNLVDVDGDGLKDIVTGKTYWSHHRKSPMWDAGAVVYWFRLVRNKDGVDWIPYQADGEAGIGRQLGMFDLNGDKLPDVVVGGMKGAHVLIHRREVVDKKRWQAAQPKRYTGAAKRTDRGGKSPIDAKTGRVPGAVEGEALKVLRVGGGKTRVQDMTGFKADRWSGGKQLFWSGAKPRARLELEIDVAKAGSYDITAALTVARDYAIVNLLLDDEALGQPLDLYEYPGVKTTGQIDLGQRKLTAGKHRLTLEIIGANASAVKAYMVGLDYVRLKAR